MRRDSTVRKFYRAIAAIMHSMHWTRDPIQKRLDAPRATIKSRRVGATKRVRRAHTALGGQFPPQGYRCARSGGYLRVVKFGASASKPTARRHVHVRAQGSKGQTKKP
eukprot:CAMPEP_0183445940 /NCGR_PEP_ID=MMETSP0370-20130417/96623_1 /TAXON_ID=268820 /ORGANISM="Peridinium aciculiferum, Strain PAER-2" /LENGTH=107 /DNA_ID=CAMNT_0025636599 /DNA_START=121 /DNA_END=441 /DNA_ORIENTATION=-